MNVNIAQGLPPEWAKFARFFSALGDSTRQQILLIFERDEEICVNEICKLFKLSRSAISHHLRVLREANLLCCEKRGKEVYYRVNYAYCAEVLKTVYHFVNAKLEPAEQVSPHPTDTVLRHVASADI